MAFRKWKSTMQNGAECDRPGKCCDMSHTGIRHPYGLILMAACRRCCNPGIGMMRQAAVVTRTDFAPSTSDRVTCEEGPTPHILAECQSVHFLSWVVEHDTCLLRCALVLGLPEWGLPSKQGRKRCNGHLPLVPLTALERNQSELVPLRETVCPGGCLFLSSPSIIWTTRTTSSYISLVSCGSGPYILSASVMIF